MITNVTFTLNMNGKISELASAISTYRGVVSVNANTQANNLNVQYDTAGISCERLEEEIQELGCSIKKTQMDSYF